jgi:hypothetical protein
MLKVRCVCCCLLFDLENLLQADRRALKSNLGVTHRSGERAALVLPGSYSDSTGLLFAADKVCCLTFFFLSCFQDWFAAQRLL